MDGLAHSAYIAKPSNGWFSALLLILLNHPMDCLAHSAYIAKPSNG